MGTPHHGTPINEEAEKLVKEGTNGFPLTRLLESLLL